MALPSIRDLLHQSRRDLAALPWWQFRAKKEALKKIEKWEHVIAYARRTGRHDEIGTK